MGPPGIPFGQYTDDSQLARELLRSTLACGRFDPEDYSLRIRDLFLEDRIVGGGMTTRRAAHGLARGVPWHRAGIPSPSAGNGSAMRAGPVGLLSFDDPAGLIRVAHDQGRITHRDPRCSAGAVVIAGAVALVLGSRPIEPGPIIRQLAEWAGTFSLPFGSSILELGRWIELPPGEAVAPVSRACLDPGHATTGWQGVSPFVVSSVLWSLYSFLRFPEDYRGTIRTAIAVGGDVDTTAAMAGSISGAHLGLDAIPAGLAVHLTDRGTWGFHELVGLAHDWYDMKMGQRVKKGDLW